MNTTPSPTPQAPAREAVEQIERALAKGPTPGPWEFDPRHKLHDSPTVCASGSFSGGIYVASCAIDAAGYGVRDAEYIAACNPENIRAVLALLAAKQEEVDRMRAEMDGTVRVLRSDVKYAMGFLYSHEPRNEPLKVWARFGNALDAQPDPNAAQQAADIAAGAQPRILRTTHG